jgi:hypothetical protein
MASILRGRPAPAQIAEVKERKALVSAFREWEAERRDEIAEVLRRYRHKKATRTDFTEAELQILAELQGEIDYLEYVYEEILCSKDDHEKYLLFREDMGYE